MPTKRDQIAFTGIERSREEQEAEDLASIIVARYEYHALSGEIDAESLRRASGDALAVLRFKESERALQLLGRLEPMVTESAQKVLFWKVFNLYKATASAWKQRVSKWYTPKTDASQ